MLRTTALFRLLLAGAPAAFPLAPASAGEEDTQLWLGLSVAGELARDLAGGLEISERARGGDVGGDQLLTRLALDYRLSPSVALGGGFAYVDLAGGHEMRPHQQLTITAGNFALRTRLEERFFGGADRMQMRLRQRVQASFPIADGAVLSGAVELLAIVRPVDPADDARIEQWRANLTLRKQLFDRMDANLGYLLILSPREGRLDRISHVPQIGLTWRP